MITNIKLGRMGRLGNQLFQYAALKSLAIKNNYALTLPNIIDFPPEEHGQRCLLGEFNIEPDAFFFEGKGGARMSYSYMEPDWRQPDLMFFNIPDWTNVEGYFQSTWYFEHCRDQIKKELTPKQEHLDRAGSYIESVRDGKTLVSLHIRRGDNTDAKHIRTPADWAYVNMYEPGGLYDVYYRNAVNFFQEEFGDVRFLVFTGGAREEENNLDDLEWCRNRFNVDNFVVVGGGSALDDFCRIMLCDHNILSPVSSFGWWAAYQNVHNDAIRIAPRSYHPEEPAFMRPGFYPKEWRLL